METAKGKLKNKKTGDELAFLVNPTDIRVEKQFNFAVEPRLAQGKPLLAFQSGGVRTLSFSLFFDKDIDEECDVKGVLKFVESLEEVESDTRSVSPVTFQWGSMSTFEGYVDRYCYTPQRFDRNGEPTSIRVEFSLIQGELGE